MAIKHSNNGDHLKNIQPTVAMKSSIKLMKNRKEQLLLHHLRLGRSKLNGQDPIDRKDYDSKLCEECKEVENTSHFLLSCQKFSIQRYQLFNEVDQIYNEFNIRQVHRRFDEFILGENQDIPKSANQKILFAVLSYIKNTNRF